MFLLKSLVEPLIAVANCDRSHFSPRRTEIAYTVCTPSQQHISLTIVDEISSTQHCEEKKIHI